MYRFSCIVVVLLAFSSAAVCSTADWPQFRGPSANGVSNETGLPETWDSTSNVLWKVDIPGSGWSAPVVSRGKVIVTTAVPEETETPAEPSAEQDSNTAKPLPVYRFEIYCFDLKTGEELWSHVALEGQPRIPTHHENTYASETPVTDGKLIVAYFGMNGVFCYDFQGKKIWEKDLGAYRMRNGWGTSSSPTMHDGLVFFQIDSEEQSFLVALDAETGEERWRVNRDEESNWGSPIIWQNNVRDELVLGGAVFCAYDPVSGDLLWQMDAKGGRSSSTPAGTDEMLVVGAEDRSRRGGGVGGLFAIRAGASGDITLAEDATENEGVMWVNRKGAPSMASPLVYQDFVYVLGRQGGVVGCYHADTGEEAYRERLPESRAFWTSPWAYDGKIFCQDDSGATHVIASGPEFQLLHTNKLEGRFWATTAVADGMLILRSDNTLYGVGL